jgi:aryl-alcohol dehydrogenase-like predicted oxidoreductase
MHTWQFANMLHLQKMNGWTRFTSMQPLYNLTYREEEREMLPLCEAEGIGVIPWSPIAGGFLTGRYTRGERADSLRSKDNVATGRGNYTDADYDVSEALVAAAKARGVPPAQMALAWVLSKSFITAPLIGSTKTSHIDDAVAALALTLTPEETAALEAPYRPKFPQGLSQRAVDAGMKSHRDNLPK